MPTTWERFCEAAVKVLLALVPSLFKVLWDHWPKTPAERRQQQTPSSGDEDQSGGQPPP